MIEVYVESIRVNKTNGKRVVMLKEKTVPRYLPIWIGHFEADAIAIQKLPVSRPLTHDLLVAAIPKLDCRWLYAIIDGLSDETFFAKLVVESGDRRIELDCRPSDAISTAIRARVPIYVDDQVFDQAAMTFSSDKDARVPENGASE